MPKRLAPTSNVVSSVLAERSMLVKWLLAMEKLVKALFWLISMVDNWLLLKESVVKAVLRLTSISESSFCTTFSVSNFVL